MNTAHNKVNPKKLLLSKWTAVQPIAKAKAFFSHQGHCTRGPQRED
jgi:hypothetical protein